MSMNNSTLLFHPRRINALQLIGSGSFYLDAAIRAGNSKGQPIDLETIKLARHIEDKTPGCRLTMIRMLDREIRRQERAQAKAA